MWCWNNVTVTGERRMDVDDEVTMRDERREVLMEGRDKSMMGG